MSASNAVCQYFIAGKCRFGGKCRYLHPGTQANAFNSLTGGSALSSSQYGQQRQQQQITKNAGSNRFSLLSSDDGNLGTWHGTSNTDKNTYSHSGSIFNQANRSLGTAALNPFLTQQQEDMSEDDVPHVENIKSILCVDVMDWSNCTTLWPLTSYSPIGGISLFPEFEDVSAEEMRWEYCLAHNRNNLQEYTSKLNQLMMNRKSLISQLSLIKREDLDNRLISMKDKFLLTTNPMQNPITNTPVEVVSSTSLPSSTKALTPVRPSTITASTTLKSSPQAGLGLNSTTSNNDSVVKTSSPSLTKEELDAFKADRFTLGKIPTHAPPPELC